MLATLGLEIQRKILIILGTLLRFSALCVSKDAGSLESIYRRRRTKPFVIEAPENCDQASAPEHLNMIAEDPRETGGDGDPSTRIPLSGSRQVSCPEFELRLQDKTRNSRKIHSMGS